MNSINKKLIIFLKIICTIICYPIIFTLTGFGIPFKDWLISINLFQKYDVVVRRLLEEIEKKIEKKDSDIIILERLGAKAYSDDYFNYYERRILNSEAIQFDYPPHYDFTENYLEVFNLETKENKYIFLYLSYASFKLDEIIKVYKVGKDFEYFAPSSEILIDNRNG
jgi:hypothetical protein